MSNDSNTRKFVTRHKFTCFWIFMNLDVIKIIFMIWQVYHSIFSNILWNSLPSRVVISWPQICPRNRLTNLRAINRYMSYLKKVIWITLNVFGFSVLFFQSTQIHYNCQCHVNSAPPVQRSVYFYLCRCLFNLSARLFYFFNRASSAPLFGFATNAGF